LLAPILLAAACGTDLALDFGRNLTGSLLTETIVSRPGVAAMCSIHA
jgi:ABC-type dipeptide/oligopeptide/nickel transport system permease component